MEITLPGFDMFEVSRPGIAFLQRVERNGLGC